MSQVPELSRSLQFRKCIHQSSAMDDLASIVAAIRGEACDLRPPPRAVDAVVLFRQVGQFLGAGSLSDLWRAYRSEGRPEGHDPRGFARFLANQDAGRDHPALPDLARLDLGQFLAGLDEREAGIGACCLPAQVIAGHPDLVLRLKTGFRYLGLAYPVHAYRAGIDALPRVAAAQPIRLRLAPDRTGSPAGIRRDLLPPARFAFESALARGRTLAAAASLALVQDAAFDWFSGVATLIDEGAVADVILHTKP
jgi:hypothetical protein